MKTIKLTENGVEKEYILTERRPIIQCVTCGKTQYPCNHEEEKPKGKLISEWLQELPCGYRELALDSFKSQGKENVNVDNMHEAIRLGFSWVLTKEKDFWHYVYEFYAGKRNGLPQLPKPKFEVWKPKVGNATYEINCFGEVFKSMIYKNQSLYTAFKTESEAIEAHEKALFNYEVEMFIKEKNEGWDVDFKNEDQKHFIAYSHFTNNMMVYSSNTFQHTNIHKYLKTPEIGEEILAKFDNDKLLKYWI